MPRRRLFIRELEYLESIDDNDPTILGGRVRVASYTNAYAEGSSIAAIRGSHNTTVQGERVKANSYTNIYVEGSSTSAQADSYNFAQIDSD